MDRSLTSWLALREEIDTASRSARLLAELLAMLPVDRAVRVLDLGTGTGSNVPYLSDLLPVSQDWLIVDRDEAVLAEFVPRMKAWAAPRGWRLTATPQGCDM